VGKGTGLGLSVSFGIIEDHQGSLEAVSPLPEGTITEPLPAGVLAAAPQGEVPGPGTLLRVTLPLEPINPPPPPQEG
jgi:signal transduction histidine kinase